MRLQDYLDSRGETYTAFGRRAGVLRTTLRLIASGESRARIDIARAIVLASRAEPAPDGQTVTYDDLDPTGWDDSRTGG